MFSFRLPFILSLFLLVIFAKNVHGNGTAAEPASPSSLSQDELLAFQLLRGAASNGTDGKNDVAANDVEGLAKTIMHILVSSVDAVMRFFGDIISKVTRSLDDQVPHKITILTNETEENWPQSVKDGFVEANVPTKTSAENGTAKGAEKKTTK
ncbi:hypothetical protein niasHT_015507 [Heterodera trifolii]|uniref:Effector protein n=1 Tax=Heterodera trifolii TaxID=157864 RepID=A0ABD2L034_9BILA